MRVAEYARIRVYLCISTAEPSVRMITTAPRALRGVTIHP